METGDIVRSIKDLNVGDRVLFPNGTWAQRIDVEEFDRMTRFTVIEIEEGKIPFLGMTPDGVHKFYLLPGEKPAIIPAREEA